MDFETQKNNHLKNINSLIKLIKKHERYISADNTIEGLEKDVILFYDIIVRDIEELKKIKEPPTIKESTCEYKSETIKKLSQKENFSKIYKSKNDLENITTITHINKSSCIKHAREFLDDMNIVFLKNPEISERDLINNSVEKFLKRYNDRVKINSIRDYLTHVYRVFQNINTDDARTKKLFDNYANLIKKYNK